MSDSKKFSRLSEMLFFISFILSSLMMLSTSNIPKYFIFSFSPSVFILSWFRISIPSVIYPFPLVIISMTHFSMAIPFFYRDCIVLLLVVNSPYLLFYFLKLLDVVRVPLEVNLFKRFRKFVTFVHFLCMRLSSITTITNTNSESTSLWISPLLKFFSYYG